MVESTDCIFFTAACQEYVLGMKTGEIQDCQITGSYSPDSSAQPHHGRLDASTCKYPFYIYTTF